MTANQSGRIGKVITLLAAKGGCGKTTFATNLAVTLHARGANRTCLVDLNLVYGDVAMTLAIEPTRTLADALPLGDWSQPVRVHRLITTSQPGLDCVLAPERPGDAERVPAALVHKLLDVLPSMYDYVVVDTPVQVSSHVLAALDLSDHRILLATPERPALKNLRMMLDMLDLLSIRRGSRSIVLNQANSHGGLTADDIDFVLRSPIAAHLPSTRDIPASVNRGVPLTESEPDHPFSLAVRRFVDEHIHGEEVVPINQEQGRAPPLD